MTNVDIFIDELGKLPHDNGSNLTWFAEADYDKRVIQIVMKDRTRKPIKTMARFCSFDDIYAMYDPRYGAALAIENMYYDFGEHIIDEKLLMSPEEAAISAICNACGKIDCDKMDKCEKLQLPPANNSEIPNSSDTISRQAAIDGLRDYLVGKRCPDDGTLTCRLIENEVINKLPPIQHEIVRCKDCKNYKFGMCLYSMTSGVGKLPNGFCDWAERREVTE